jgi:Fe-S-cluster containining protein
VPLRHRYLNVHAAYACRHSGACCSSGWDIPIERDEASRVHDALATGRVAGSGVSWLRMAPAHADAETAGILALQPNGHCIFHRRSRASGALGCAIHAMRPASCAHFPFVYVIDARGVHVTLSHYCPTAAALLFDVEQAPAIVEGPPIGPGAPEGLDAADALPPVVPGSAPPRLMSWTDVDDWEARAVHDAIAEPMPMAAALERFGGARAAVPAPLSWPDAPPGVADSWHDRVEPSWSEWGGVIRRYLASKLVASWAMYLGDGPADVRRGVELARAVLQVECARQCARTAQALDRARLTEAIRQSDLLLAHYADRQALLSSAR